MRLAPQFMAGLAMAVVACGSPIAGPLPGEGAEAPPPHAETAKLITEDAPTVEPGKTEIELTYHHGEVSKALDDSGHTNDRAMLEGQIFFLTATHGIADGLDGRVTVLWRDVIQDDEEILDRGEGNVIVNIKWRLFESGPSGVSLSWLPGLTVPFSIPEDNEPILSPGQDFWSLDNLFALTIPGERLNGSLDAGFILPLGDRRDDDRGILVADAAIGYQVSRRFQPMAELNFAHGYVKRLPDSDGLSATLGAVLNLSSTVRLDLGAQRLIDGRNVDVGTWFLANLSITF